jgi:PleD family two-component response regulator
MSIGVACLRLSAPEISLETSLQMADRALYRAKEGRRNQVCFIS